MSEQQKSEESLGPVLHFMRLLWGLDHSLQTASKRMEANLGVTGPQRLVIRLVGRFPGISAGELAQLQQLHPSTLTGVLRRLQKRGFLKRRPDPADGRRALLTLTAKGARLNELKEGTVEAAIERALSTLNDEALKGAHLAVNSIMQELVNQGVADAPPVAGKRAAP